MQPSRARYEDHRRLGTLAEEPKVERWSRSARFFFILGAATLCWLVPALAVYLLIAAF